MKILIVEDNVHLVNDLKHYLSKNGYIVESVQTLQQARSKIGLYQYDLAIIDIGLPDGNGLELIGELRKRDRTCGVLIVTAKNAIEDKVDGLDMGADDYITKPFHLAELNARIRSILRRGKFQGDQIISFNEIQLDIQAAQAFINDKPLKLTRKEYDLLLYFLYNKNQLLTRENIAEHLWGDHIDQADSFDFLYNHIKNLRKKMIAAGGSNYIQSMYGMGYKFTE